MRISNLLLVIFLMVLNLACEEKLNRPLAPPTPLVIVSFSPQFSSEVPKDILVYKPIIVTIIGTGFSSEVSGNIVVFAKVGQGAQHGRSAAIVSATTTQLTVEVPYLSSYGKYDLYLTAFGFTVKAQQQFTF